MVVTVAAGAHDVPAMVHEAAERVARESRGRLLAFLAERSRDLAGAEDALADAFAAALRTWPDTGVPDNPDAWLLTAARRNLIDAARRDRTRIRGEERMRVMSEHIEMASRAPDEIPDRRLALMFACAHPAIDAGMRAPLILQAILGLTAGEIAAAFLIPPATMGQRLVRAKTRIRQAGIPFRVPDRDELPGRLDGVLEAIYAAYSRGWAEIGHDVGSPLAEEAMWLGRLAVTLLPDEPEARGMLALMFYAEARRAARRDAGGAYVPLDEQDTTLWDIGMFHAAEVLLSDASATGPSGRYQLEAAIQSAHMTRRLSGQDTRHEVLALYDHLLATTGSPVVALNRAVALAAIAGPEKALDDVDTLGSDRRLLRYQPYWAVRAHLLAEAGRSDEAREALTLAIGLSADGAVRRHLVRRLAALDS